MKRGLGQRSPAKVVFRAHESILRRRLIHMVDHHHRHRPFLRLHLQTQLPVDRLEHRNPAGFARHRRLSWRPNRAFLRSCGRATWNILLRRPRYGEVVCTFQLRRVHRRVIEIPARKLVDFA